MMRIWILAPLETLLADVFAWVIIHLGLGYLCSKIPINKFNPNAPFYQTKTWEKEGILYQQLFHVRSWKKFIPQGSKVYRNSFSLQHLTSVESAYLDRWLRESIRAEFCHWVMIIPGGFFFLWNTTVVGFLIIGYALVTNLVPIVLQRYNRPRIRRLIKQTESRMKAISICEQEVLVSTNGY